MFLRVHISTGRPARLFPARVGILNGNQSMDIKLSIRALRDSGLPIDWMTLKVGVDGIEFDYG